jgi:hypothetical protein
MFQFKFREMGLLLAGRSASDLPKPWFCGAIGRTKRKPNARDPGLKRRIPRFLLVFVTGTIIYCLLGDLLIGSGKIERTKGLE